MEQHQVPQHIASYEFHLIGDMTLKQFFQVATGGLIALAIYASPLPGIIKWPAILFFGILGIALAFLPLEERPLSTWILLFLKGIYSPTLYKRGPQDKIADIFAPETEGANAARPRVVAPHGEEAAQKYLSTPASEFAGPGGVIISSFDEREESFLKKVLSVFHQVPVVPSPQIVVEEHTVPKQPVVEIPTVQAPALTATSPSPPFPAPPTPIPAYPQPQTLAAHFVPSAAPPFFPQTPNIAVGQVVDEEGNGVESAILEIRDQEGRPARALRTNKVGHFLTATPLTPGAYLIIVEKEGYEFSPVGFSTMDTLIPPIEIKGKKINAN